MFSWQGEKFSYRQNQSRPTHQSHRKKRQILESESHVPVRKDEPTLGAFVMTDYISTIDDFLVGSARKPFWFPRRLYIISIMTKPDVSFYEKTERVLEKLWIDYGISNAIIITPCAGSPKVS